MLLRGTWRKIAPVTSARSQKPWPTSPATREIAPFEGVRSGRLDKIYRRVLSEAVKLGRVVGENILAYRVARRPVQKQVKEIAIVRRAGLARRGMRPVARPQHALRCVLHQRLRQAPNVLVFRRAGLRSLVRRRQLHPAPSGIDQ